MIANIILVRLFKHIQTNRLLRYNNQQCYRILYYHSLKYVIMHGSQIFHTKFKIALIAFELLFGGNA
jgi:hypothetical protein